MRLWHIGYSFFSSRQYKFWIYFLHTEVVCVCCQFTVRKSSRSTFSKLDIGIFIKFSVLKKIIYILLSFIHIFSLFKNNRLQSCFSKYKRRKQSWRSTSYYYWTLSVSKFHFLNSVLCFFYFPYIRNISIFFFIIQLNIHCINVYYVVFISGIYCLPCYLKTFQLFFIYTQHFHHWFFQIILIMLYRHFYIIYS